MARSEPNISGTGMGDSCRDLVDVCDHFCNISSVDGCIGVLDSTFDDIYGSSDIYVDDAAVANHYIIADNDVSE